MKQLLSWFKSVCTSAVVFTLIVVGQLGVIAAIVVAIVAGVAGVLVPAIGVTYLTSLAEHAFGIGGADSC